MEVILREHVDNLGERGESEEERDDRFEGLPEMER